MSSNREISEELKKNLRAVLLSKVGGVELHRIAADYRTYIGHPLPYRHYGFQDVQSLLQAIPDVAR